MQYTYGTNQFPNNFKSNSAVRAVGTVVLSKKILCLQHNVTAMHSNKHTGQIDMRCT